MKKRILLLGVVIGTVILISMFTGCSEPEDEKTSIDERIRSFVSDLNGSNLNQVFKDHFLSDSPQYHGDAGTVDLYFPTGSSYSVVSISGSTVIINKGSTPSIYTFEMREDGSDNWYIWRISLKT